MNPFHVYVDPIADFSQLLLTVVDMAFILCCPGWCCFSSYWGISLLWCEEDTIMVMALWMSSFALELPDTFQCILTRTSEQVSPVALLGCNSPVAHRVAKIPSCFPLYTNTCSETMPVALQGCRAFRKTRYACSPLISHMARQQACIRN